MRKPSSSKSDKGNTIQNLISKKGAWVTENKDFKRENGISEGKFKIRSLKEMRFQRKSAKSRSPKNKNFIIPEGISDDFSLNFEKPQPKQPEETQPKKIQKQSENISHQKFPRTPEHREKTESREIKEEKVNKVPPSPQENGNGKLGNNIKKENFMPEMDFEETVELAEDFEVRQLSLNIKAPSSIPQENSMEDTVLMKSSDFTFANKHIANQEKPKINDIKSTQDSFSLLFESLNHLKSNNPKASLQMAMEAEDDFLILKILKTNPNALNSLDNHLKENIISRLRFLKKGSILKSAGHNFLQGLD